MKYLIIVTLSILTIHLAYSSTKKATITAHCYSFQLGSLDWRDGDVTYFTTYDNGTGQPHGTNGEGFIGEFRPDGLGSSTYRADFVDLWLGTSISSYGTISIEIPLTDTDSDGFPDFLQKDKTVNTTITTNAVIHWDSEGDYVAPSAKILFRRSANSNLGTYQLTESGGTDISTSNYIGSWYVNSWTGEVSYDDQKNLTINGTRKLSDSSTEDISAWGSYEASNNSVVLNPLSITSGTQSIKSNQSELSLSGSSYSGQVSLIDGDTETSWKDFENWKVFITDTNDHDSDGIPDLTDPPTPTQATTVVSTPAGKPVVEKVGDVYNWSDNLDGVTLWTVEKDEGNWDKETVRFENGKVLGNSTGFYDDASQLQPYGMFFAVDENGYLKVSQSAEFTQEVAYFNVTSFENETIGTINDESIDTVSDNGVNQINQWFFATRAAAEEFYTSKASPPYLAVSRKIKAKRDRDYLQEQQGPLFLNKGEVDLDVNLPNKPSVTSASVTVDGQTYNLLAKQAPSGFSTESHYPASAKLFGLEADESMSTLVNGKSFAFSIVSGGHTYAYTQELPAVSDYPEVPTLAINSKHQWKTDTGAGGDYVEIEAGADLQVSWNTFASADIYDYIKIALVMARDTDDEIEVFELELPSGQTTHTISADLLEAGKQYDFGVHFFNVTQAENPTGFTHFESSESNKPLLQSYAENITFLQIKTLPAATKGWMWFDQYPWVYSDEEKGWLYFRPSGDKLHYWSYRDKAWREFTRR